MYSFHEDGTLPQNGEVFVFGSNLGGKHDSGAALVAYEKFGMPDGEWVYLHGNSFAIPTYDENAAKVPLSGIKRFVEDFVLTTQLPEHANTKWFVTRVGCGWVGHKNEEIAPMFRGAKNCSFAIEWEPYLNG